MKKIDELKLDDLLCIYHCLELELQRLTISCMPDTLRPYWNQLNKVQSFIHSLIIDKEDEINAKQQN